MTDEMELCGRSPFPLWSSVLTATSHVSQPGTDPWWVCVPEPANGVTSASPHSSCTHGRKQPEREGSRSTSPCHSSPLLRRSSTACTRLRELLPRELLTSPYVPNPHATVLPTMAFSLEKFIHSLDTRALPRVLQIQSGIYCQGEHRCFLAGFASLYLTSGPPLDWNVGEAEGRCSWSCLLAVSSQLKNALSMALEMSLLQCAFGLLTGSEKENAVSPHHIPERVLE